MKKYRKKNLQKKHQFDFIDPPPVQTLITSLESLFELGALDDEGLMTRLGRRMAEFPLEPGETKVSSWLADRIALGSKQAS